MLVILSPAKTLDESPTIAAGVTPTTPQFTADADALAAKLAKLSEKQIAELMDISPKLAALNAGRYRQFTAMPAHPCAWMFRGDVYNGLDIDSLPAKALPELQRRVRILSGLYGVLRPSDMMRPYRLEMGTSFAVGKAKNLYQYWGSRVSEALNVAAEEAGAHELLNLASQEYSGVVDWAALKPQPIVAHFKERKNGQVKVVSLFAKRARGTMARWIVEQKATRRDLPEFAEDGYRYEPSLSTANELVFVRGA